MLMKTKGREKTVVGRTHDVDENKDTYFRYPTMLMKRQDLL